MKNARFVLHLLFVLLTISCISCRKQPEQTPTQNNSVSAGTQQQVIESAGLSSTEPIQNNLISVKETAEEKTEYFAVFMEGQKIGYAIQKRSVADNKVTTAIDLSITLSRAAIPITVTTKAVTVESPDGKPLAYETEQKFGFMATKTVGTISLEGKVTVTVGDQQRQFDWPKGAVMSEGMSLLIEKQGLKQGTKFTALLFDPGLGQATNVDVVIGPKAKVDLLGRVVELTEVTSTVNMSGMGAITTTEYYNDDFALQKSVMPILGMTIEQVACTKEFALSKNDVFEVIDMMFTASPEPLRNLGTVRSITYQLSPVDPKQGLLNIPQNDNQKVQIDSSGKITLTIEPVPMPAGLEIPYAGSDQAALDALKPADYVQSSNPQIIALARQAVGDTKDAAQAARKIEAFVAQYIENKNLSVGYASALEVAGSRQGDCTEFSVLCTALCRAAGIPARVVAGIAYVDDFMGKSGFGGHAWTEAYIGGKWVGLDAAFTSSGRGGYDAGHIALAWGNGEPAEFFNLATTLGRFKIDKVSIIQK
jgi:hypothetical protein